MNSSCCFFPLSPLLLGGKGLTKTGFKRQQQHTSQLWSLGKAAEEVMEKSSFDLALIEDKEVMGRQLVGGKIWDGSKERGVNSVHH